LHQPIADQRGGICGEQRDAAEQCDQQSARGERRQRARHVLRCKLPAEAEQAQVEQQDRPDQQR
jgi:hypothetical protein